MANISLLLIKEIRGGSENKSNNTKSLLQK